MSMITKVGLADRSNYGDKRVVSSINSIVIHYTANDGDSDTGNANYFKTGGREASAHYFVDDNSVTQSVPDNYIAWHCGGRIYDDVGETGGAKFNSVINNNNSIGIEMCDTNKNGKYDVSVKTIEKTQELVKYLMKKYKIDINKVVRHFDVTGKYCPRYLCKPYGKESDWDKFKSGLVDKKTSIETVLVSPKKNKDIVVKVNATALLVRSGPGKNNKINGTIRDGGVYTIVEILGDWGRLKSGAGWIHLGYTKRV